MAAAWRLQNRATQPVFKSTAFFPWKLLYKLSVGAKKNNFCNICTNLLIHTYFTCNGLQYVTIRWLTINLGHVTPTTPHPSHGFSISSMLCLWWLRFTPSHRTTFLWTNAEIGNHHIIYIYYMYVCMYVCLSIYLSVCLSIYLSIYLSISRSLSLPLSTRPPKSGGSAAPGR